MATPAIQTEGLTKVYGDVTAVAPLDLEVAAGEVFGLLGPNGAGKTTTILMLLGLTEPSGGTARVAGLDPVRQPLEVKRRVGYLPDNVGFYPSLTGRQNLRYTARLNGLSRAEADRRIDERLGDVGLADAGDRPAGAYSRGMRQRLGIADALLKDPSIVILDEPTIAIDPEGVAEVLALIRGLGERGAAVLLSSHLLYQVQSVCDRVGLFVAGRLVAVGRMDELAQTLTEATTVVELGVEGEPAGLEEALRAVDGVTGVARERELWIVSGTRDVRGPLTRAAVEAGATLTHLRRRGQELDDLYHRYFHQEEVAAGA